MDDDDVEAAGNRQKQLQARGGKTRIVQQNRATIMDVARGRMTVMGFLDDRTSSRRLGFHERSEQNNIAKMEKV